MISPPSSQHELSLRASSLAGKTLAELASEKEVRLPKNLKTKKGWQGQFIETCLGADAGNLSKPDFSQIDIELKTLPIDFTGKVLESTYVCVVDLNKHIGMQWRESSVYQKLKQQGLEVRFEIK